MIKKEIQSWATQLLKRLLLLLLREIMCIIIIIIMSWYQKKREKSGAVKRTHLLLLKTKKKQCSSSLLQLLMKILNTNKDFLNESSGPTRSYRNLKLILKLMQNYFHLKQVRAIFPSFFFKVSLGVKVWKIRQ